MAKNTKKQKWFKKIRNSYLPVSFIGMMIYLIYLFYLISLIGVWFVRGYNIWEFITQVIPLSIGAALITQYIASKNS